MKYQILENALCNHKTGQKKRNLATATFLQFWADGGVHKAIEKMGKDALKKLAIEKGIDFDIIEAMEL